MQFPINFVNQKLKMGLQGKNLLSSSFSEEINSVFSMKKSRIDTKNDKFQKIPFFHVFIQIV